MLRSTRFAFSRFEGAGCLRRRRRLLDRFIRPARSRSRAATRSVLTPASSSRRERSSLRQRVRAVDEDDVCMTTRVVCWTSETSHCWQERVAFGFARTMGKSRRRNASTASASSDSLASAKSRLAALCACEASMRAKTVSVVKVEVAGRSRRARATPMGRSSRTSRLEALSRYSSARVVPARSAAIRSRRDPGGIALSARSRPQTRASDWGAYLRAPTRHPVLSGLLPQRFRGQVESTSRGEVGGKGILGHFPYNLPARRFD